MLDMGKPQGTFDVRNLGLFPVDSPPNPIKLISDNPKTLETPLFVGVDRSLQSA